MFSNEDTKIAKFVNQNIPPNAIFLTSDSHNHPIPTLTGRQILMGYRGWLWTYGIDYSRREQDIKTMFLGNSKSEDLFKKYNVNYVIIGPSEIHDWHANTQFFEDNYLKIFQSENYKIYKIP